MNKMRAQTRMVRYIGNVVAMHVLLTLLSGHAMGEVTNVEWLDSDTLGIVVKPSDKVEPRVIIHSVTASIATQVFDAPTGMARIVPGSSAKFFVMAEEQHFGEWVAVCQSDIWHAVNLKARIAPTTVTNSGFMGAVRAVPHENSILATRANYPGIRIPFYGFVDLWKKREEYVLFRPLDAGSPVDTHLGIGDSVLPILDKQLSPIFGKGHNQFMAKEYLDGHHRYSVYTLSPLGQIGQLPVTAHSHDGFILNKAATLDVLIWLGNSQGYSVLRLMNEADSFKLVELGPPIATAVGASVFLNATGVWELDFDANTLRQLGYDGTEHWVNSLSGDFSRIGVRVNPHGTRAVVGATSAGVLLVTTGDTPDLQEIPINDLLVRN